ncbi:hypothetical protein IEQ34_005758 [Dendrobium chrysotoxum]|uniref:Uncharacterized protein n=1 Tax=Dendrobium chrysotoxum TaxID=161865 RepID=A0AAV7HC00_DENCH|nr:hypothetical protein IEQ34_005758 [Dendrobium chrysotoxum]
MISIVDLKINGSDPAQLQTDTQAPELLTKEGLTPKDENAETNARSALRTCETTGGNNFAQVAKLE